MFLCVSYVFNRDYLFNFLQTLYSFLVNVSNPEEGFKPVLCCIVQTQLLPSYQKAVRKLLYNLACKIPPQMDILYRT